MARNFGLPTNRGNEMDETPQIAPTQGTITLTNEQLQMLIEGAKKPSNAGMTAKDLADAFASTQRRENPSAPMVSFYNPKGENVTARPRLRAKTLQNGVELDPDTLTWEEIEALNALPNGVFYVTKGTGSKIKFTVEYRRGADEESIERVDLHFPCKDEHRFDHRPLLEYCFEVLESAGKDADLSRLKSLQKELNALRTA